MISGDLGKTQVSQNWALFSQHLIVCQQAVALMQDLGSFLDSRNPQGLRHLALDFRLVTAALLSTPIAVWSVSLVLLIITRLLLTGFNLNFGNSSGQSSSKSFFNF